MPGNRAALGQMRGLGDGMDVLGDVGRPGEGEALPDSSTPALPA